MCRGEAGGGLLGYAPIDSAGVGLVVRVGGLGGRGKLEEGEGGIFNEFLYFDEEGDGLFAVDEAVVVGEGEVHHRTNFDLA